MLGLEKLVGSLPNVVVRDYKENRSVLSISFTPKEGADGTVCGIPSSEIPNQEIYLPGNSERSQAFLAAFVDSLRALPGIDEILKPPFSVSKEEILFLGEVSYVSGDEVLKITDINELKLNDEPKDVKAEETQPSGKLPFKVSYVISSEGEPYVEIYVLTLHPELREKLGNLIHEKIKAEIQLST